MKYLEKISKMKTLTTLFVLVIGIGVYAEIPAFDSDKPNTTFNTAYTQTFNKVWDAVNLPNGMDPASISDYDISMDFEINNGVAGPLFAATDGSNFFYWQIYLPGDGSSWFRPHSWINGTFAVMAEVNLTTLVPVVKNTIYTLKIQIRGDKASTYINNTLIDANRVNPRGVGVNYGYANIGFRQLSIAEDAYFDNIKVTTNVSGNPVTLFEDNFSSSKLNFTYGLIAGGRLHEVSNPDLCFATNWDSSKFNAQWDQVDAFDANDAKNGYVQFYFPNRRIIRSKLIYTTPYIFSAEIDYTNSNNRGGVVLRAKGAGEINDLQEPPVSDGSTPFNREGIALYPSADGANMIVQFTGLLNGYSTPVTKILVPKPMAAASLLSRASLKVEDFGSTIYVYYNNTRFIRIDLGGKNGNIYTSGTVFDSNMQTVGFFSGMEIESIGKVGIAQRDATLKLHSCSMQTVSTDGNMLADKPVVKFQSLYNQEFTTWNQPKFDNMWNVLGTIDASTIVNGTSGYLMLGWPMQRVIESKISIQTPYIYEIDFAVVNPNTAGGVIIRASETTNIDELQSPGDLSITPYFNSEGIAFFASADGSLLNVQFSGEHKANYLTSLTRIVVPAPLGVNLRDRGKLRIEDYDSLIYVFYNNIGLLKIMFDSKIGTIYSSGTVYDAKMNVMGTFSGMEIEEKGKLGLACREGAPNNTLNIYQISVENELSWDTRPNVMLDTQYNQTFTIWDADMFSEQWDAYDSFGANDIVSGYLQFGTTKRILRSKHIYTSPYIFETETEYTGGNSSGGIVIRAHANGDPEDLQIPASGEPGFNREGIAFYPSEDGLSMTVQFSGTIDGTATPVTRISVPKPALVTNLKNKGILRIEDYGASINIFYNNAPYIRIDLGNKIQNNYTSGIIYNSDMQITGTFSNISVPDSGRVAISQHDAAIKLYRAVLKAKSAEQIITFNSIGKKTISDVPFQLIATSTSGLLVTLSIISGPASIAGTTLSLTGTSGYVIVTANQSGNNRNLPAKEIKQIFYVENPNSPNAIIPSKAFSDNWVATDALGRTLPFANECRASRSDKFVGMFYYLWQCDGMDGCPPLSPITNNTEQLADGKQNLIYHKNSYWAEPEAGYYRSNDPWVIRRNLQMLSNAGVDFLFFDTSNGPLYLPIVKKLCEISIKMRTEGTQTPYISFIVNSEPFAKQLYNEFYAQNQYSDTWFVWNGKPIIFLTDTNSLVDPFLKDFFTVRRSWSWTDPSTSGNWQWNDSYPQDYGWETDKNIIEQIPVSKGSHPRIMDGVSFHNGTQPQLNEFLLTDSTDYGLKFNEQWKQALKVDPQLVMITQWNEWISGVYAFEGGSGMFLDKVRPWYAVDEFNMEFSRDIEPMKGGYSDNYYYQMVSNIRKYKGMQTQEAASTTTPVLVDGIFDDWNTVSPVYKDPLGDTEHRNFLGSNNSTMYSNLTGRNDIVESRTTYDNNNIYFYVKTAQPLTAYSNSNWMLLFIDADRDKGTGWEGYDYVVNLGVKSSNETTLKKWDGVAWGNEVAISYKLTNNQMELSIPRQNVLMDKSTPAYYFHWADNPQSLNDISSFFTEGESAPDRRFNYNFSTSNPVNLTQSAYKSLTIPGTLEMEDFDNGGAHIAYADATFGNDGGVYRPNESVDIFPKTIGGYYVGLITSNEWLEYTVDIKTIGTITATIHYASVNSTEAILYVNGVDKSGTIILPPSGGLDVWVTKSVNTQLAAGKYVLKFFVNKASNDLNLDKILFTEKNVVYPGNGTGLSKSIWSATVGGRTWFKDSVCSEIDPFVNKTWEDVSPGCGVSNDFWNIRWQGQIQSLFSEIYTFYITANDLGRVWINNQLVIDAWSSVNSGNTLTGTIALTANQKVPIKVDFAEKLGSASIKLEWSSESNPREVVPQYQLYPLINPNGLSDIPNAFFSIYPNPAKNKLTIDSGTNKVTDLNIIDLQGRIVYSKGIEFIGRNVFDLGLDKGVYFLKLSGEVPFKTQKLIIK